MRRTALIAALVLALGPGPADPASAADPFYEGLMETGISAYARGDHATAAEDLRLASFGLLEVPQELAECLTYLAVAQAEVGDDAAFTRTIDRLLEVERRFQAFSGLSLDAALRQALEKHLLASIPFEVLDRSVVFRDLGRLKRQAEIREMPPAERREELARRLAAEPGHAPWRLLLAELDFAEGRYEAVAPAAEALLQQAPEMSRARCLRGLSRAALGRCEQALPDFGACDGPFDTALLEQRLRCHLALRDLDAAAAVLARVGAGDRQRQPFRQLARDLDRARTEAASEPQAATVASEPPPATAEPASEPPSPEPTPPAPVAASPPPAAVPPPPPAPAVSADVRAELERLEASARTRSREELEAAFAAARELADSRPELAEPQRLAAVIAYRLSRWPDVVTYSRRAGEPETPDRQFYLAVALFEAGDRAAAKETLERCLPLLESTEFVRAYADKILR